MSRGYFYAYYIYIYYGIFKTLCLIGTKDVCVTKCFQVQAEIFVKGSDPHKSGVRATNYWLQKIVLILLISFNWGQLSDPYLSIA